MRSIRCLKQKEIRSSQKNMATSSDRSEISGLWRIKLPQRLILSLRWLLSYVSSNLLWHIHTKHGQMMSLWWNAPNADRLSKLEHEGQTQFQFPLLGDQMRWDESICCWNWSAAVLISSWWSLVSFNWSWRNFTYINRKFVLYQWE